MSFNNTLFMLKAYGIIRNLLFSSNGFDMFFFIDKKTLLKKYENLAYRLINLVIKFIFEHILNFRNGLIY